MWLGFFIVCSYNQRLTKSETDIETLNNNISDLENATILLNGIFTTSETFSIDTAPYRRIAIKAYIAGYVNYIEIPTSIIEDSLEYYWLTSFFQDSTSYDSVSFGVSKTQVKLAFATLRGANVNVQAKVYGIK